MGEVYALVQWGIPQVVSLSEDLAQAPDYLQYHIERPHFISNVSHFGSLVSRRGKGLWILANQINHEVNAEIIEIIDPDGVCEVCGMSSLPPIQDWVSDLQGVAHRWSLIIVNAIESRKRNIASAVEELGQLDKALTRLCDMPYGMSQ